MNCWKPGILRKWKYIYTWTLNENVAYLDVMVNDHQRHCPLAKHGPVPPKSAVEPTLAGLGAAAAISADKKISYREQPRQKIFESSPAKLLSPAERATSRQSFPVARPPNPPSQ